MTSSGKRPPLREELSLFHSAVAAEGITTAAGAAAGTSIIDAGLIGVGANSFVSMLAVVYAGLPRLVDSMEITAFNNVTGEVTLSGAYKGVAAAIPAGVRYKIVTSRFAAAGVTALTTLVNTVIASQGRQIFTLPPFASEFMEEVQLGAAAATIAMPDVVVAGIPAGAIVVEAKVNFVFNALENTNAVVNMLNGATVAGTSQVIQVRDNAPGAWTDAINFVDNLYAVAATTREMGSVAFGQIDVSGEVDGNGTYEFRWLLGRADLDFLNFNNTQVLLVVSYSV